MSHFETIWIITSSIIIVHILGWNLCRHETKIVIPSTNTEIVHILKIPNIHLQSGPKQNFCSSQYWCHNIRFAPSQLISCSCLFPSNRSGQDYFAQWREVKEEREIILGAEPSKYAREMWVRFHNNAIAVETLLLFSNYWQINMHRIYYVFNI